MSETIVKYDPLYRLKDEKFDIDQIPNYNLYLALNHSTFSIGVIDTASDRCLHLESYYFDDVQSIDQYLNALEEIVEDHHFLKVQFWNKVMVSLKSNNFTLVPYKFFEEDQIPQYLGTTCNFDVETDQVAFHKSPANKLVTVFYLEKEVSKWLDKVYFGKSQLVHHTATLLDCLQEEFSFENQKRVFLHVDYNQFTIFYLEKDQLDYCNVFNYSTIDELVDLVHYVIYELNINTEDTETICWFNSSESEEAIGILSDNFPNIYLGARPEAMKFGYMFDELEEYQFFDLLSMHSCK